MLHSITLNVWLSDLVCLILVSVLMTSLIFRYLVAITFSYYSQMSFAFGAVGFSRIIGYRPIMTHEIVSSSLITTELFAIGP